MCAEIASADQSLPLSRHPLLTTEKIDEAAHTLSRTLMPIRITRVTEPRRFRLDMNGRRLGRLFIGFNRFATNSEVEIDAAATENLFGFAIGSDIGNPSYFDIDGERVTVSARSAAILSPARETRIHRPDQSCLFALTTSRSVMEERYAEITGRPAQGPLIFKPALDLTKGSGRLLQALTRTLVTTLERDGDGPENPLLCSTLEDAMISIMLGLADHQGHGLTDETERGGAPWMVWRAEEYMAAHATDPITVSDLVAACGCSRSSLYAAFRSNRGYSPMEFLASRRLELARERLMREPNANVTRIALECGFSNQGRFAKAYRERFGELPSRTRVRL